VSALGKFSGFGRKNSQTSDLTGNLVKADPQKLITSGSYRPEAVTQIRNIKDFMAP
jgi:hypothetical protein